MMTKTQQSIFSRKVAAILIMAIGWGWIDGNFIPDNPGYWFNALLHCIPLAILLALGLRFFRFTGQELPGQRNTGLTIFAVISLISLGVMILLGASNPDPNAVGVKTLPDWFPTVLLALGSLTWLTTLLPGSQRNAKASSIQEP